jgi:HK97 family phage portal protein
MPVTEETAFTVSAFWCCVRVISETIAQMPWRVFELMPDGKRLAVQHPADRLLDRIPNAEQDPCVWRELMLRNVLVWGNAYCEIVRDDSYRPIAIWPLEPWRVTPTRSGGSLWYKVAQWDGAQDEYLPAADVLHFRGLGDDLAGWSILQYAARTIGLGMAQENSMASQMEHGSRLSGILMPVGGGNIPEKQAENLAAQWNAQHSGSSNHGKVYFLSKGLDYKAFGMPNTDAQLLESRQFSVVDICRFFRVPPHLVYDLTRATFSNITHQSLEFLIHTLGPWICKFEQQANRKLISQAWTNRYLTRIDSNSILRMDPDTRANWYKTLRELGAISPNEVRAAEDMNSLGPDGDLYLVPVNMQSLERASEPPAPPPAPTPPQTITGDDGPEETDDEGADDGGN